MLSSLIDLLFPRICLACGNNCPVKLKQICLTCRSELPQTNWHLTKNHQLDKLFWGRLESEKATSFFKFEKGGKVQQLIHQLKYKGMKEVGVSLGEMAATELLKSDFFELIDCLVPVPIHPIKQQKRGFNQSQLIADGVANITSIPLHKTALIKSYNTSSQTKKSRFKRWLNVDTTFELTDKAIFKNKNVLLIDDVVTTGSTIEACAKELLKIEGVKINLLTIAATY